LSFLELKVIFLPLVFPFESVNLPNHATIKSEKALTMVFSDVLGGVNS